MTSDARPRIKQRIRQSQLGICAYCFKICDELTVDHIVPKYHGGTDAQDNLVAVCYECNHEKGSQVFLIYFAKKNGCRRQRMTKARRKREKKKHEKEQRKKHKKEFANSLNSLEKVFEGLDETLKLRYQFAHDKSE